MSEKIKILFLAPHLSTGGMPSFLVKRIQAIIDNDLFEVFVVEYTNFSDHYVVQKNQIKSLIKGENFFTLGEDKYKVIDIIKQNKIDIVHIDEILEGFGQNVPNNLINDLYDNNRTWKIVETCHNVWFDPNSNKKFHPDAYAFCTPWHKYQTFSKMPSYGEVLQFPLSNQIASEEDKLNAKINLGFDVSKKHVINVGLWTSGKNQGEGVEIARILETSNPEIVFHFIGNQAPNFEEYWGPIMKNIPSNVRVWGERSDIDDFMKASDLFMFNSTWECNPLVLKEAISHGLKIVSRNLPQYMNMFTEYITPIIGDAEDTAKKMVELLSSDKNYQVQDENSKFSQDYTNFYLKVYSLERMFNEPKPLNPNIIQNFINNPYLEIKGYGDCRYRVEFYDPSGRCHYSETLSVNHWIRLNRQYYTKWTTKIWEDDVLIYNSTLNLKNKRVYIALESKSLGDTLAWVPYIRTFKDVHQCELIVSTFMNDLFIETYPDIEFVNPGMPVSNIYAMYKLGWFYKDDGQFDISRNPNEFKTQPLQKTSSDILGLPYVETKPIIKKPKVEKMKKVGIGIHSTCQAKYWNNPNGWQSVVDYLKSMGYEVVLYSRENDGYMGNFHPQGITKFESGGIQELINDMSTCEFFVGLGSGLSWLAWALDLPVVLISGFSDDYSETTTETYRVINKSVCHGCFNRHRLNASDWMWCPDHQNTERQFECTKNISPDMVIDKINLLIQDKKEKSYNNQYII